MANPITRLLRVLPVVLFLISATASIYAQSDSAVLFGLVTDPSGSAIKGAKVRLTNKGNGQMREYMVDDRGLYYFTLIPPGMYELQLEAPGFKQYVDDAVRVQVAQVGRLDVEMEIGSNKESVNVSESGSGLNSDNVTQGTVVGSEKIPSLPLNGRQFLQLALLVPGANPGGRTVQQNSVRQSAMGGLSIAGGRTNNTAFLLDGAANTDPDFNSLNYSPSVDTIAEFQVQTAMVGAEYGRASVNITTKSGTNEHHVTLWEFLRNKSMDARPFNLNRDLPKYQRNQYGAAYGGPIKKEKLFSFVSWEGLRVRQAAPSLTTVTVPTAAQRLGDFGRTTILDPDSPLLDGRRQAFPDNRIPASRINPLSRAAVNAVPLPNSGANFFVNATGILTQDNDNYSGRLDYNMRENWTLFGRYSVAEEDAFIPAVITGRDRINDTRSQNAVIGTTGILTTNLLNESRLSFSRLRILNGLPELSFDVNGQTRALPQFIANPYPIMGGTGAFNATRGGGTIQVRDSGFQFYNNLAWRRGSHFLKFGGEIYHTQYNRIESPSVLGDFQFTPGYTGDALATMLLALPSVATRNVGPSRIDGRSWSYSLYVQDDYKLRPNLTVNLGLRYELAPPVYDKHQQLSNIDFSKVPSAPNVFAEGRTAFYRPTLFICGQSGYPKGCVNTDRNNFAPRVGIVYELNPKTVVRGGGGIFYALNDYNTLFRLAAGLPGNILQTVNSPAAAPALRGFDVFGPAEVNPRQTGLQMAGLDMNQRTSYSVQYNASVQRQISKAVVVELGYLANLGLKLEQNVQPNNSLPSTLPVDPRRPYVGVQYAPGTQFPSYVNVVGDTVGVGFIQYFPHSAQSNYHSMFLRVEKRFTSGLSVLGAYTWSKSITNAPQFRNAGGLDGAENSPPQDSLNLRAERGLASFHVAHRWVNTMLYDLPFGQGGKYLTEGIGSKILGGLQISAIYTMQSGFPFTVNLQGDTAGIGAGTGGIVIRPNAVPGKTAALSGSARSTERYFDTTAFSMPAAATYGNVGRNTVIGPPLTNLDLGVSKSISLRENLKLQLRAEAFNVANHSNYTIVGRIINSPQTFGKVLGQLDPRQIQFGAKLLF